MRTIKIKSVMVAAILLISIRMFSGGTVSFDNPIWKVGDEIKGRFVVGRGWKIIRVSVSGPLTGTDIPLVEGWRTGKFNAWYKGHSEYRDDAIVFLVLKSTETLWEENESNAPNAKCTIVELTIKITQLKFDSKTQKVTVKLEGTSAPMLPPAFAYEKTSVTPQKNFAPPTSIKHPEEKTSWTETDEFYVTSYKPGITKITATSIVKYLGLSVEDSKSLLLD